jgi:hypothetical protein
MVVVDDLLRDFLTSPVTSVSLGAKRTPLVKGLSSDMQIAHFVASKVNEKMQRAAPTDPMLKQARSRV